MRSTDERRNHLRYTYLVAIDYMLNPQTTDEIFKCTVVNISNCGMSLLVSNLFYIGQKITIKSALPNLAQTAVVRWVKQFGGFYKVGVECDDKNGG
jgi:hypothetical protein